MDTTDPFYGLDFTAEDVKQGAEARKNLRQRNGGVCICGHAAGAHSNYAPEGHPDHATAIYNGTSKCIPSRVVCACTEYHEVLIAEDLRQFRHSTKGPGIDHALALGLAASRDKDKKVEWKSGELVCFVCHQGPDEGVAVSPVAFLPNGAEANKTTDKNELVCHPCRDKIRNARAHA